MKHNIFKKLYTKNGIRIFTNTMLSIGLLAITYGFYNVANENQDPDAVTFCIFMGFFNIASILVAIQDVVENWQSKDKR